MTYSFIHFLSSADMHLPKKSLEKSSPLMHTNYISAFVFGQLG